jgi:hypothetical protein
MKGTELIVETWEGEVRAFVAGIDYKEKAITILSLDNPADKLYCVNPNNPDKNRKGTGKEKFNFAMASIKKGRLSYKKFDKKFPKEAGYFSGGISCAFE